MKLRSASSGNTLMQLANSVKILWKDERNMMLFAYEGILITLINNLINNNNNLFATRLGASDFQISLVSSLPQVVGMIVLIPGGVLTDRMANKRKMVIVSLCALEVFYLALGFVPMMDNYRFIAFLILISLSVGPMTLYNASWQAYFSDVVPIKIRNKTFTVRTRWTFIINIAAPLITGNLLASVSTNEEKLKFHQSFFWISCLIILLQIFVLKKISGGNAESINKITIIDLKNAALDLAHNRRFLGFVSIAFVFYMSWQSDWTMYYLGEIKYLKLNEAWLGYLNVGGALMQFLTVGFWSRVNERHGIRFSIIMGALGLSIFPLTMILGTSLPLNIGKPIFFVLNIAANFAFATVYLDILQCLLQVIPEKNKTLSIAIYTLIVTFSNAVAPVVGVKVYTGFGANLRALQITFLLIFILRFLSAGLWTLRWWLLRKEPK